MNYLQVANAIETYNMKAQSFQTLFREFDFQGFLKMSAQMNVIYSYHILAKYNPLAVPEAAALSNYNALCQFYTSHLSACFSERFPTDKLSELLDLYESIPEQYRELLTGWQPEQQEIALCRKIIEENTFFRTYGKERFIKYQAEFMDAVLAKSLPNMSAEDVRGLVGMHLLDEERVKGFLAKGLLSDTTPMPLVYEALGIEQPVSLTKEAVKTVGVTYRTKSGESRQALLADLNTLDPQQLRLVPYLYQKQGQPDTNAVAVYWGDEDIANLSQTTVDAIFGQIEDPQFTVTGYEVTGGYSANASYGVKVSFKVSGMPKKEAPEADKNQSIVVSNPMNI